jgi:hypothetical protein
VLVPNLMKQLHKSQGVAPAGSCEQNWLHSGP